MACYRMPNGFLCTTSFGAWLDECKERHKRGERQRQCEVCCKWYWPLKGCGCQKEK